MGAIGSSTNTPIHRRRDDTPERRALEYRPQLVPNLACNKLPGIQNDNGGGRNMIRKYDYESRFVVRAEVDEENHVYPADPQINNRFPEWAMDCMLLLLDEYQHQYVEECPASVLASTEEYMDDGNPYVRFRQMFLVKGRLFPGEACESTVR